jgi:flagellar FliL protein
MSKKLLIIIIAVAFVFMGMMGAGFFLLWSKVSANAAPTQTETLPSEEQAAEADELGPLYSMGTLIVNLSDQGGKRYLRVTMELELGDVSMVEKVDKRIAQIRDSILMILPTKSYDDISTTAGKTALRDELIAKINSFFKTRPVTNLYFTEFVVQ